MDATDNERLETRYYGCCVVDSYNRERPYQALDMKVPARGGSQPPCDGAMSPATMSRLMRRAMRLGIEQAQQPSAFLRVDAAEAAECSCVRKRLRECFRRYATPSALKRADASLNIRCVGFVNTCPPHALAS
jgi:hypothetical protein